MFDAHRHYGSSMGENALYATSSRDEWELLSSLIPPAVGGVGALAEKPLPEIGALEYILKKYPLLQISEVGLDRRFPEIEKQEAFLKDTLALAFELGRSVSLHCVKEDGRMLSLLRALQPNLPVLLWHGYTGSWETAQEAAKLGVILSYGSRLFGSKLAREGELLVTLPYALETDFQMGDYSQILWTQIENFSKLSGCSHDELIRNNNEIRTILTHNTSTR
nr:TatD family hydrolase [uncultured Sphaerochaeta sp.]